jgi:hypothetical protein
MAIPVAARPKTRVCCRLIPGDCGFESCWANGYLALVCVVFCQVEVSVTGRSFVQRSPTECVCMCVMVVIKCNSSCLQLR